jgi:8-oxo-dGTP diphosphatase
MRSRVCRVNMSAHSSVTSGDAEARPPLAIDEVDAVTQTLTPAEAASVEELRHGLLQKVKAWLRGEA